MQTKILFLVLTFSTTDREDRQMIHDKRQEKRKLPAAFGCSTG